MSHELPWNPQSWRSDNTPLINPETTALVAEDQTPSTLHRARLNLGSQHRSRDGIDEETGMCKPDADQSANVTLQERALRGANES